MKYLTVQHQISSIRPHLTEHLEGNKETKKRNTV